MTTQTSIAALNALKTDLSAGAASAASVESFINGDFAEIAADGFDFAAALSAGVKSLAVKGTVKATKFVLEKSVAAERKVLEELRKTVEVTKAVEDAAKTGELVAKVAEFLPGLSSIKTFQIPKVLDLLGGNANFLAGKGDIALQKAETALETKEKILSIVSKIDTAATVLGALAPVFAGAADKAREQGGAAVDEAKGAEALSLLGATDAKLTGALDMLNLRLEAASSDILDNAPKVEKAFEAILGKFETDLAPVLEKVDAFIDAVNKPVEAIEDLKAKGQPFVDAVSGFAKPFDAFFDFLENPPSISVPFVGRVSLFPAIDRDEIQKIIDFLSDLSGAVLAPLNLVLKPILGPAKTAVNKLLDKLFPAGDLIDEIANLDDALLDLLSFAEVLNPIFNALESELASFEDILDVDAAAFTAPANGAATTFFGGDAAEKISAAAAAASGPRSAAAAVEAAVLSGAGGDDTLEGAAGDDFLLGGAGADVLTGAGGDDVLFGGAGDDVIEGGAGDDLIDGGAGIDSAVFSGAFADYEITSDGEVVQVSGVDGEDDLISVETLIFSDGAVDVASIVPVATDPSAGGASGGVSRSESGGAGADVFAGGGGNDDFSGGAGANTAIGGAGDDTLSGGGGKDRLIGGKGDDELNGGGGKDLLKGGGGADVINGGGGSDVIKGGGGGDLLIGGGGRDDISGGGGADTIEGGRGADNLTGGGGRDTFVFSRGDGRDRIEKFQQGLDLIEFKGADGFDDLTLMQQGENTVIGFQNVRVIVEDQDVDAFGASDFIF